MADEIPPAEDASSVIAADQDIDFCTLGMFIIDEIHWPPPKESVYDILGGAGTWSALGGRLFSPAPSSSKTVSWILDRGSDFPPALDDTINSWQTSALVRTDPSRLTTRGWNSHDATENRAFKYTTPKKRLDADSVAFCKPLLRSKSFHLICSPDRCIELARTILSRRRDLEEDLPRPIFIWEPVPDLCVPDQLLNLTRALPYIDICSPNATELGSLLGYAVDEVEDAKGNVNPDFVEGATEQLLGSMPLSSYAIVVRCGKSGLYVGKNGGRSSRVSFFEPAGVAEAREARRAERETRKEEGRKVRLTRGGKTFTANTYAAPTPAVKPAHMHGGLTADTDMMALFAHLETKREDDSDEEEEETPVQEESPKEEADEDPDYGVALWYPAYQTNPAKVIDPTGGGNSFLGALAVGLARGKGLEAACRWGSVAASFAIEQVGTPTLSFEGDKELWNGDSVQSRLEDYEMRVGVGFKAMNLSSK